MTSSSIQKCLWPGLIKTLLRTLDNNTKEITFNDYWIEFSYDVKNYADRGQSMLLCFRSRLVASIRRMLSTDAVLVDNSLRDLHSSSHPMKAECTKFLLLLLLLQSSSPARYVALKKKNGVLVKKLTFYKLYIIIKLYIILGKSL